MLAAVAEEVAKYEVFSAVEVCNERLVYVLSSSFLVDRIEYYRDFLSSTHPRFFSHAVKLDYPILINAALPRFSPAPFIQVLEKLLALYMVCTFFLEMRK